MFLLFLLVLDFSFFLIILKEKLLFTFEKKNCDCEILVLYGERYVLCLCVYGNNKSAQGTFFGVFLKFLHSFSANFICEKLIFFGKVSLKLQHPSKHTQEGRHKFTGKNRFSWLVFFLKERQRRQIQEV